MTAWFGVGSELSAAQECARAVLILLFAVIAVRVAGRRLFGRWAAIDIIVSVIAGSNLSRALTGSAPLWGTLLATAILIGLHWLAGMAIARWPRASHILEGKPIVLGADGSSSDRPRWRHAVSRADLDEAARLAGVESIEGSQKITLEPSGTISVLAAKTLYNPADSLGSNPS